MHDNYQKKKACYYLFYVSQKGMLLILVYSLKVTLLMYHIYNPTYFPHFFSVHSQLHVGFCAKKCSCPDLQKRSANNKRFPRVA